METYTNDPSTLRDYLKIIFRHKIIFYVLPIAILIPVYISFELKMPIYQASVEMYVKGQYKANVNHYSEYAFGSPTEKHSEFLKTNIVIKRVVKALKLDQVPIDYELRHAPRLKAALMKRGVESLKQKLAEMSTEEKQDFLFKQAMGKLGGSISALPGVNSLFFYISVRNVSPEFAAVIANSVSRSYLIFDLEQQILELQLKYGEKHSTVIRLKDYIKKLEPLLDGRIIPDLEAIGPTSIKVMKQAIRGKRKAQGNRNVLLVLSFVTSMFLSVILCFIFHYFDQTFRSPQDIVNFLDIPFLGSIPKRKSKDKLLVSDVNPHANDYIRSYQNLCDQTLLMIKANNIKSLLITDSEGSQDNAFIVVNIGTYIAQKTNNKVLIIDADLRESSVSKIFNISDNQGLNEVIEEKVLFEDAVHDLGSNLYVLPSGKTVLNPVTLLDSSIMSKLIKTAEERYDLILINSAAGLKDFMDSVILSSITSAFAVVINEGKIRRQIILEAMAPLKQKKVKIIGAVLNNRRYVIPEIIYKLV